MEHEELLEKLAEIDGQISDGEAEQVDILGSIRDALEVLKDLVEREDADN